MEYQHLIPLAEELMPKAEAFFRPQGKDLYNFYGFIMNLVPTPAVAAYIFKSPLDADFTNKCLLIKELEEAKLLKRRNEEFLDMRIDLKPSGMMDKTGEILQADRLLFEVSLLREEGEQSFTSFVYFEGGWYFLGMVGRFLQTPYADMQRQLAKPLAEARALKAERAASAEAEAKRHNVEAKFDSAPEVFFEQFLGSELAFARLITESIAPNAVLEKIFTGEIVDSIDETEHREICLKELASDPDPEALYYGVKVKKENATEEMLLPLDLYRIEFIKHDPDSALSEFRGWWIVYEGKWYVMLIGS